jgi:hypothetical protein
MHGDMLTQMKDASHTEPEMENNKYSPESTESMWQTTYSNTHSTGK